MNSETNFVTAYRQVNECTNIFTLYAGRKVSTARARDFLRNCMSSNIHPCIRTVNRINYNVGIAHTEQRTLHVPIPQMLSEWNMHPIVAFDSIFCPWRWD